MKLVNVLAAVSMIASTAAHAGLSDASKKSSQQLWENSVASANVSVNFSGQVLKVIGDLAGQAWDLSKSGSQKVSDVSQEGYALTLKGGQWVWEKSQSASDASVKSGKSVSNAVSDAGKKSGEALATSGKFIVDATVDSVDFVKEKGTATVNFSTKVGKMSITYSVKAGTATWESIKSTYTKSAKFTVEVWDYTTTHAVSASKKAAQSSVDTIESSKDAVSEVGAASGQASMAVIQAGKKILLFPINVIKELNQGSH